MAEYRELTLTLHGLDEYNQAVDGEVFARKFAAFMRGLGKSDAAANGGRRHRFLISDLKKNTATAIVREQVFKRGPAPASGISYYVDGVAAVYQGVARSQSLPRALVSDIASLTKGAGRTFQFAEIKGEPAVAGSATVIRIDEFLENRARRVLQEVLADEDAEKADVRYFEGNAFGSFDGILKAIDLRGDLKKAALILSAGGKEIECIVNTVAINDLGDALDRRVIAYGMAHYERHSGLPVRIDVRKLEIVRDGQGLSRWRGAFDIPPDAHDRGGWDRT